MAEFLDKYGNIHHCWEVHVAVMKREGEPWVTYPTFRYRVRDLGWDAYTAIHTPSNTNKMAKRRKRKFRFERFIYWFKQLWKKDKK